MTEAKQTVLITGGAQRLGAELVRALALADYQVVIHYNSSKKSAEALLAEIKAQGGTAALVKGNLTKRADRRSLIVRASKPFGPLSILINNASLYQKDTIADLDEDQWDNHFAMHTEAPIFLSRDFAAQLPKGTQGNIINIIDERVLRPAPAAFSYHLSKSVLWTATQTLAQSLAPNVRVNAIGPGPIIAEAGQSQATFNKRGKDSLLGHNADPADVVEAMFYLLSASNVTGQMLAIDAGEHLAWPKRRGPTPKSQPKQKSKPS